MYIVCGEALFDLLVGEERSDGGLALDARAGGSPFNVAIGLARLGAPVGFYAGLSLDPLGDRLFDRLEAEAVDTTLIARLDRPTTLSLVGQTSAGTPAYTFYGAGAADRSLMPDRLPTLPATVTALHFGSYTIVATPTADAVRALAEREAAARLLSLDPNVRPSVEPDMAVWRRRIAHLAKLADVIKASTEDLALLWPGRSTADVAQEWLHGGAALVVITMGEKGATAFTAQHEATVEPSAVKVVDTVGAGDSFQAALLNGLRCLGMRTKTRLAAIDETTTTALIGYANRAAALTCSRRGADLPLAAELGPPPGAGH
ncbi:MAG: carbohydrate kinase [Hyphomicrobiaceae bacterium]